MIDGDTTTTFVSFYFRNNNITLKIEATAAETYL
jgi:hypothetical protein